MVKLLFTGCGSVVKECIRLLERDVWTELINDGILVVGVSDTSCALYNSQGLPVNSLVKLKTSGKKLSQCQDFADLQRFEDSLQMVSTVDFDVLIECTTMNLKVVGIGQRCA